MRDGYSKSQIWMHWAVVGLVGIQFLLADGMSQAFDTLEESGTRAPTVLSNLHIAVGAAIFLLILARFALRQSQGAPAPHRDEPGWMKLAARAVHLGFYALLVLLPVTGATAWFRASETAGEVHEILKLILLVLIVLHAGAALYHHYVLKSDVMRRMVEPRG